MSRRIRPRSTGMTLISVVAAVLAVGPATVAGRPHAATSVPRQHYVDLSPALNAHGTFRGASGVAGTVDTSAWSLVSNLGSGEPPRFVAAASSVSPAVTTPIGPWSAVGANVAGTDGALNQEVQAVAVSGSDVYVGGWFTNVHGIPTADYVARWDGSAWHGLGSNVAGTDGAFGCNGSCVVYALAVSGSNIYVGGGFTDVAGNTAADYVARWDGSDWHAMGTAGSINNDVFALAVSGSDVYAGGYFTDAGGTAAADYVAKWDGSNWSALPDGSGNAALHGQVNALASSGGNLYVGGQFLNAAGIPAADHVARWDGSAWHALGSNGAGDGALNNTNTYSVTALAVAGSNVYVGGNFGNAANIPQADHVARWDGAAWHALGSNSAGTDGAWVSAYGVTLAMAGTDLYVGGYVRDVAGIPAADMIAMWNGKAWFALGSDGAGNGALGYRADAMAASGSALYVGGAFLDAAHIPQADWIARWTLIRKPDGRIRLDTGTYVGNNVYNTTGLNQTKTGSATPGHTISFGISIQNDGNSSDRFKLNATGTTATSYTVKYFRGTTDITAAVVAGTYQTPSLAAGATYFITAKVTVKTGAAVGSSVTRLVTISSIANSAKKDAVKFIGKRA
jgi:hypothetical protein